MIISNFPDSQFLLISFLVAFDSKLAQEICAPDEVSNPILISNFLKILEGNYVQQGNSNTTGNRGHSTSDKAASRNALEKEASRILQQFATEDS